MRRPAAALIALVTAVALTACSPDAEDPQDDGGSDADALAAVVVTGDLGTEPKLEFERPFTVEATVTRVDVAGDGDRLETGQRLTVHYVVVDGETGETLASTWETGSPQNITLGDPQIPELNTLLVEQSVGARVVVGFPGGDATDTADAYPAAVMAMEVIGLAPARAQGEAVPQVDGYPIVTLDDDGAPSIEVPADAVEPTELVVQPLIIGDGPAIEAGQTVVVQYSGWLWDGTLFDSSWENGAPLTTAIGAGQLIPGWDEGLVGQTIGSQLLLLVPAEMGYGDAGSGTIPPGASLIFVVDLLEAP